MLTPVNVFHEYCFCLVAAFLIARTPEHRAEKKEQHSPTTPATIPFPYQTKLKDYTCLFMLPWPFEIPVSFSSLNKLRKLVVVNSLLFLVVLNVVSG